jgi:hypothetical protein
MDVEYPGFGTIVVFGVRYDHDVVIEAGEVRTRDKGPSRSLRSRFGHTPLSADEEIPCSAPRLVIGTGHSGRLPILPGVLAEAAARGVAVTTLATADACELLRSLEPSEADAILHVTC